MPTSLSVNLYLDTTSTLSPASFLASTVSRQAAPTIALVAGDAPSLRLWLLKPSATIGQLAECLTHSGAIIFSLKAAPGDTDAIAQTDAFTLVTSETEGDHYEAPLNLNTEAMLAKVAALGSGQSSFQGYFDIELQASGNTSRITYQGRANVFRQIYATGPSPASIPSYPAPSQLALKSELAEITGGVLVAPAWENSPDAAFPTCTIANGIPAALAGSGIAGSAYFVDLAIPTWGVASVDVAGELSPGTATNCSAFLSFRDAGGGEIAPDGGRIALTLGSIFAHPTIAIPANATRLCVGVVITTGGQPFAFSAGFVALAVVAHAPIAKLSADALAAIQSDKAQAQSDASTVAALVSPAQAAADAAQQAKNDAQAAAEGLMGSSWDATIRDEYLGLPVVRFASHSSNGATGYMFGTGAEASCDGTLKSISTRVGTAGAAAVVVGRLQKDGKFSPRASHGITLVSGVTEYAVGAPILRGETIFLLCISGTLTYKETAPGRTYFSYATGAPPAAEVTTSKNAGASVALGFTVSGYGSEFDISPSAFAGYTVPSGWTLSGGVLTAGGSSGDTDGRRAICAKRYYAKKRAWEFDVLFNGSIMQFGFAALSAWGKTGTTLGVDPNGRALVLYDARDGWGALAEQSSAVIPSAFDFGTKCRVRLVRHDRMVSCSITDAKGVTASVVSAYPSGDYLADAGSWGGVYSAGWASDQPFFTWYAAGTGPAISSPKHTIIGHSPLLFLGDSITEGYGCSGNTWAELSAAQLGLNATLLARSGCTVGDLLACEEMNWVKPRVAVVSIGANGGNSVELLNSLVARLKARGAVTVILCRYPSALGSAGNAYVDASATANSLTAPPQFDVVTANAAGTALDAGFECGDAIHPNEAGQSRMAAALIPALSAALGAIR